jgi:hypothetical protein
MRHAVNTRRAGAMVNMLSHLLLLSRGRTTLRPGPNERGAARHTPAYAHALSTAVTASVRAESRGLPDRALDRTATRGTLLNLGLPLLHVPPPRTEDFKPGGAPAIALSARGATCSGGGGGVLSVNLVAPIESAQRERCRATVASRFSLASVVARCAAMEPPDENEVDGYDNEVNGDGTHVPVCCLTRLGASSGARSKGAGCLQGHTQSVVCTALPIKPYLNAAGLGGQCTRHAILGFLLADRDAGGQCVCGNQTAPQRQPASVCKERSCSLQLAAHL